MCDDHDSSNPAPAPGTLDAAPSTTPANVSPGLPARLAAAVETDVKISDLQFDPKLQLRAKPHDGQYIIDLVGAIQTGALTEPIVVFRDPTVGSLRVADGHARVDAMRSVGSATIRAHVHQGGLREAFEFALGANAKHGVRRTIEDLRHAVLTALADPCTASYTSKKIAELCHCSDHYVGGLRRERSAATGNAPEARVTGEDGKSYPARRPRKASVPTGSILAISPPVAESIPTSTIPASASSPYGGSDEMTSLPRPERLVLKVLEVVPVEQTAPIPGDSSHAVATAGALEPTTARTATTVPTDATVVSALKVIPSSTKPAEAMVDPVAQIREFLTASKQVRMALPNLRVPQFLLSEFREEAVRLQESLRDHGRPTVPTPSMSTTHGDMFRGMMGYTPRPGHASDEAILGVLAAEIDHQHLTA